MSTLRRRTVPVRLAAVLATAACILSVTLPGAETSAATPSIGTLQNELGHQQARQQTLSGSIAALSRTIASLESQITLVQAREATVTQQLAADRAQLRTVQARLAAQRARLAKLRAILAKAESILRQQLVSSYESPHPDLVSVVLNANGFNDLLNQLNFLGRAEHQQQSIISITREAKAAATAAAARLVRLTANDRRIAAGAALQARELAGMNRLLQSRQDAVSRARSAQSSALAASQAASHSLRRQISRIRAQQAAARAAAAASAAAAAAQQASSSSPVATGPALGAGGGWAIPYAIVLCESGGQNLPPNSAGASGYYQILPSTWKLFGGTGPAAWQASKSEQDAVAARIWRGGAGASNWVCAGIVGIH